MMVIRRVMLKVKIIHLDVNLSAYSTNIYKKCSIARKDCNAFFQNAIYWWKEMEIESRPLMAMTHTITT